MNPNSSLNLASIVSNHLRIPAAEIDTRIPFSQYGMDSIAGFELAAAIEKKIGRRLPDTVLIEQISLQTLERYLCELPNTHIPLINCFEQMHQDSLLPSDIQPEANNSESNTTMKILLTGATGFLGAHLLRSILQNTQSQVCCVARSIAKTSAQERVRHSMIRYGVWDPRFESRIQVLEGNIEVLMMGLGKRVYECLCEEVGAVYHAAACVNWVLSYNALRNVNVQATSELLRFACTRRPKKFNFISSVAVCFSTCGPCQVDEKIDVYRHIRGIHLGYAQSKIVAEKLVCQAFERGLPGKVFRLPLITGHRTSGISKVNDLLSRFIKSTILMQAAPDLDWTIDCCPVDYVSDAVVHLCNSQRTPRVVHIVSHRPRHWRELILWMNLYGYPVRLLPYRKWIDRLRQEINGPGRPLRELLPFFTKEPLGEGGLTLPELFEDSRRSKVRDPITRAAIQGLPIGQAHIDASALENYFHYFIQSGFLPKVASAHHQIDRPTQQTLVDNRILTLLFCNFFRDTNVEVKALTTNKRTIQHGIISELTSWKYGCAAGFECCRLTIVRGAGASESISAFIKKKALDEKVIEVAKHVAEQCSQSLGEAFARYGRLLGLAGSHLRELAIYEQTDERFCQYTPALYGVWRDNSREEWILVLEDISKLAKFNKAEEPAGWDKTEIEAAIHGLAQLHSIWYRREDELLKKPWIGSVISANQRAEMRDWWAALAESAYSSFSAVVGSSIKAIQRRLIDSIFPRWQLLTRMDQTLIHNDFNPRNLALRRDHSEFRLCAYDWELATLGVPQHDLAEFLCFVLPAEPTLSEVNYYLNCHRTHLERATRSSIDPDIWELGFRLSLHDLVVDRLAMYAMINRFQPQKFLPRVITTWNALYNLFSLKEQAGL